MYEVAVSQKGFTLIELLTTTAIIGVLAAIAVPQFQEYKMSGFDRRAEIDLRNVAIAQEAYFAEVDHYVDCTQSDCAAFLPGLSSLSHGTLLQITSTPGGFVGTAAHPKGSGRVYGWPF